MNEPRRFNLVTNGYDCYQVNNEIDRLEYQIGELNEKILMYQNQIETVNNQFSQIKKRYQLLVQELSTREKQADDTARIALMQATEVIDNARHKADQIINETIIESSEYGEKLKQFNADTLDAKNRAREAALALIDAINRLDQIQIPDIFKTDINNQ